jgi:DNA-binding NtrC family response regulator
VSLAQRTILVVDDEPDIQDIVRRLLTRQGATVLVAGGIDEALLVADAHDGGIDLAITDLLMPGGRGSDLADRLHATRPDTRVMYMSGMPRHHESVLALGETAVVLQKPFRPNDLVETVESAI